MSLEREQALPESQNHLNEAAAALLTQECERMVSLYQQAQDGIQTVFNFYLTFVTAVVGGLVVLLQIDVNPADEQGRTGLIVALLFFGALTSTVYLSALAGRYAHAGRFAYAADELRRRLLLDADLMLPPVYRSFMAAERRTASGRAAWIYYLVPVGTYQMFVATITATALTLMIIILGAEGDISGSNLVIAAFVMFFVAFTLLNAYAHQVIVRFGNRVNIYLGDDSPAWAARM